MQQIKPEEVRDWLLHPVTQAFKAHMRQVREDLKEQWASGAYSEDTEFKSAVRQARVLGQCELLSELLDVDALNSSLSQQ